MKLSEKQKLRKRLNSFCSMMGKSLDKLDADLVTRLQDTVERLGHPTKVVVAGLSGANHRGVGEFITGEQLFSSTEEAMSCPAIEVRYGKTAQTDAVFGDIEKSYPGVAVSLALAGKKPDTIRLQLPHAIFAEIDFTILPAYDGDDNRAGYLVKLLDNTEVIIWCSDATSSWIPQERRLWFTVPDTLKERSILALTNAERLTTDASNEALAKKLEFVTGEFKISTKIAVDEAKSAVQGGKVANPERFSGSGGQAILNDVMSLVQAGQQGLIEEARVLRAEIDIIPIGEVEVVPVAPLTAPTSAAPAQTEAATPRARTLNLLVEGNKRCKAALASCDTGNFEPLFEQVERLLTELKTAFDGTVELARDGDLMAAQLAEGSEVIGLLAYEKDESAALQAAEIIKQITMDTWMRLPPENADDTRNILDSAKVSASR